MFFFATQKKKADCCVRCLQKAHRSNVSGACGERFLSQQIRPSNQPSFPKRGVESSFNIHLWLKTLLLLLQAAVVLYQSVYQVGYNLFGTGVTYSSKINKKSARQKANKERQE